MQDCAPGVVDGGVSVPTSVTATFIFTDLVDSTAIAARLGPDAAEDLRQTHFRLLRGAVVGSGGTEVKNLGDGLMVMFSSPSRALAGAVGMQQAIHHYNRSDGEPLGVRIGLSAGEAVEEDGDFFGDPVVEAARLCAAATGGQILAAEIVRNLVGRHATQTFVAIGPLKLKGIPEAVDAIEVLWEPAKTTGSVPLPGRLVGAATDALFGFFGRGPELAVLDEARKQAHTTKQCQAVFVSGEAGMGKTALVAQVARTAHAEGSIVLFGHADEDVGISYQPWIEVVSTLVRDGDPEFVAGLPAAQRTALGRLVPALRSDIDRAADPDTERLLLWEGIAEVLSAATRETPVMVLLDDLHWADTASLQLLRHVMVSTTAADLTIACTYRDTDMKRGDALTKLLADLHREPNVSRIALGGLADVEIIELLTASAGHDLDDSGVGLAHALRRETDGNPFFTREVIRHLAESGGIALGDDGRWTVTDDLDEIGLPTSVRDVVGRRVERLGAEALRVLSMAAVIGREFDISLLARLADVDEDPLLDLMDTAVSAAVLVESALADRYRFAHALIQHSLYEELSPTRRARAHQRVAESLETHAIAEDAATLAELAHHWVAATRPADLDKALGYVRRAGDAARDSLAPDDAIRWYQQALDLLASQSPPDERQRAELLAELGAVQRQAAHPEFRDTLREAVALSLQLDDVHILVQAALVFNRPGVASQVGDDDAKPILRAALDRIGTDATPIRARLLAELANAHDAGSEWRVRRDLSLEAVDLARRSHNDATFLEVVTAAHPALATPDNLDQHLNDVEAAGAIGDRTGGPVLRTLIRYPMMWVRYQQADIAAADAVLAEMESLAEAVSLPEQRLQVAEFMTAQLLLAGHAEEAETASERALEIGTAAGIPETLAVFGGFLYSIRLHQGRLDEIVDFFIDAARDNPSIASLRSAVTIMLCELGSIDDAHERLSAEAANDFDYPYDATWLASIANMADAAATTGDRAVALTLVERLAPFATQVISPLIVVNGAVARPLGRASTLLGDYDQAERYLVIAHDLHARLQAPFWTARGELDHADLCVARHANGDLQRARDLSTVAAATAAEYGCAGLCKRAAALLAET
jgi:class 3 adenylate cyclase/tetratricopeptide (TPR) repeat protein